MKQATIVFNKQDESAPLYAKYAGQINPQPAYVTLDLESGFVDADYSGDVGNGMPESVWNNRTLRWSINTQLSGSQVQELLEDILPQLQVILNGSEIEWDGSNWVGKIVSPEPVDAIEKLDRMSEYGLGADIESNLITDLKDWLYNSGRACWMPAPDDEVEDFISNFDLDGYTTTENVKDVLIDMWCNELYSGEPLNRNVAWCLLSGGYCDGSGWMDELKEFCR